ncbi:MAG TPA: DUF6782 family putative metallopeptidase [Myxococcales bacterium]
MLFAALIAAGAVGAVPAEPGPAPRVAAPDPVALVREVAADVERLRGLRRKVNLKVEILDGPLFTRKVREKAQEELKPEVVAEERARWLAFDLAPADADPAQILLGVLDEQVAGFYDPHEKKLFVRSDAGTSPDLLRLVLAHEIEHALQDQNFGIPDLAKLPDDDVRLARSALLEGDAMAVMTAYAAERAGRPLDASMAAAAQALRGAGSAGVAGKEEKLARAPQVVREELLFPYVEGFALVAEAWRRGGFAQVDKLFARPPQSTHEVLHPAAYFAAEQPMNVKMPAAPAGAKVLARGKLGELGSRLVLEACLDPAVGREFVPAWAGDAFVVYQANGHAELVWESAWSGETAQNIANLLRLVEPCWQEQRGVAAQVHIVRKGSLVAVSRGSADVDTLLK